MSEIITIRAEDNHGLTWGQGCVYRSADGRWYDTGYWPGPEIRPNRCEAIALGNITPGSIGSALVSGFGILPVDAVTAATLPLVRGDLIFMDSSGNLFKGDAFVFGNYGAFQGIVWDGGDSGRTFKIFVNPGMAGFDLEIDPTASRTVYKNTYYYDTLQASGGTLYATGTIPLQNFISRNYNIVIAVHLLDPSGNGVAVCDVDWQWGNIDQDVDHITGSLAAELFGGSGGPQINIQFLPSVNTPPYTIDLTAGGASPFFDPAALFSVRLVRAGFGVGADTMNAPLWVKKIQVILA